MAWNTPGSVAHAQYFRRDDSRIIIHFDYDCFYASVFEKEDPSLKSKPLAVQQKQIAVTCNYEARRRGLHKLQLIRDVKRVCPDVVIVSGEDLTRFRDVSKTLFSFLKSYVWGGKVERLGFDEVFMDVTSMIDYNLQRLVRDNPTNAFFYMSQDNSDAGFPYNATVIAGQAFPPSPDYEANKSRMPLESPSSPSPSQEDAREAWLRERLFLGSHLAHFIGQEMEAKMGYTSSIGISTSKLLAKLVGNVNKPRNQTTLMPPYDAIEDEYGCSRISNVELFLNDHDIRKVPGIGLKLARRLKTYVLDKKWDDEGPLGTVTVKQLRSYPGMNHEQLEKICQGDGFPRITGLKVWGLLNGIDPTPVMEAREFPMQISIEDSYGSLERADDLRRELYTLSLRLIGRMHVDLTTSRGTGSGEQKRQWLARPRTLRLSTRSRMPPSSTPNTPRSSSFNSMHRTSRSCPMPQFIFSFQQNVESLADALVKEALLPLFRKLHPLGKAWKLSLLNVAATNIVVAQAPFLSQPSAPSDRRRDLSAAGRDIASMFWGMQAKVDGNPSGLVASHEAMMTGHGDETDVTTTTHAEDFESAHATDSCHDDGWISDSEDAVTSDQQCEICRTHIPSFAADAHKKFHQFSDP
ncbi:hypothetical protein KEM56_007165 [Ascosphaera pollenicola]|nr:hypothetical protein KEM56_007165 [Ascosphaera pollenicola]